MSTTNSQPHPGPDASRIAARYIAAWNEQDAGRRLALISEVFGPKATYLDPMAHSAGHDEINAMIGAVQQQFAGLRFRLHGPQDGHNNVIRFSWALGREGAEPVAHGTDVAVVSEDGRLAGVTGFLDAIAAPA
ncbi:nuclear transport factor 2 family protein [Rhodoferax sediminis]|uniref:Nuclear transport factor 2 family protein n=1 Tax=Rhodoferax sediminis TaxID=2509614 RepID=A0A515DEL8_9BURK|nr:nuclear transport factor 2 family protein [Rhodoferax sediminis]QDL38839.1 nuclear transport factor 2 family protein [Rhodoferax sediminis]